MKKITLLLFLAFASCGISYDGETRLISETTVLDRNGNFLSGIEIKIRAVNGSDEDLISSGFSNSYGNTRLIFVPPKNASIEISFSNEELGYDNKIFRSIKSSDFDNYKLIMDEVILLKSDDIVDLEVRFNNSFNTNKTLINSRVQGLLSGWQHLYQENTEIDSFYPSYFSAAKNQTIIVHYTLLDTITQEKTEHMFPILIENESVSEIINY